MGNFPANRRRGRPPKPGSQERIAEVLGADRKTLRNAKRHVQYMKRYPVMERPGWKQAHVFEAGALLDRLPEEQRRRLLELFEELEASESPRATLRVVRRLLGEEIPNCPTCGRPWPSSRRAPRPGPHA